jgi:hypothetical protein
MPGPADALYCVCAICLRRRPIRLSIKIYPTYLCCCCHCGCIWFLHRGCPCPLSGLQLPQLLGVPLLYLCCQLCNLILQYQNASCAPLVSLTPWKKALILYLLGALPVAPVPGICACLAAH